MLIHIYIHPKEIFPCNHIRSIRNINEAQHTFPNKTRSHTVRLRINSGHNRLARIRRQVQRSRMSKNRQDKIHKCRDMWFNKENPKREKPRGVHKLRTESLWWEEYNKKLQGNNLEALLCHKRLQRYTHPLSLSSYSGNNQLQLVQQE